MTEEKTIFDDPEYWEAMAALDRDGVKGLEPFIAKRRLSALVFAKEGDMKELAQLVRDGKKLNEAERNFVADILEGKVVSKKGRPNKMGFTRRIGLGFYWLTKHEGEPIEAATQTLQDIHGKSRSTIMEHKRKADADDLTQDEIKTYEIISRLGPIELLNQFKEKDLMSE